MKVSILPSHGTTHILSSFGLKQSSGILCWVLFLSKWSNTASIMFRSGLWGDQSITVSELSAVSLFKYEFTALAVCLWSLSCWKRKPFPIRCFPEGMDWLFKIGLYFSAFMLPSIQEISPTLQAEMQNRTDPPTFFSSSFYQKISNLDSSFHKNLFTPIFIPIFASFSLS